MLNMKKKTRLLVLAALYLVISVLGLVWGEFGHPRRLEIIFFDVGQGDASLVSLPDGQRVLIDGGPDNSVLSRLGDNLPYGRRTIDLMLASHYHDDHISGLLSVMERYQVGRVIYPTGNKSNELWEYFLRRAEILGLELVPIEGNANLRLTPSCSLFLLNSNSLGVAQDENNSLIAKLNCSDLKVLWSGDSGAKVEMGLLSADVDLQADIMKAGHHGSKSSNSQAFLQAVNPGSLVISSGADNRFGHPSPEVIERAEALGIHIYRTDEQGDIKFFGQD